MNLKVLLPAEVLIDQEVTRIVAEAEDGSFCLLPRHIDFTAALQPGLFLFETTESEEVYLAVDEGVLVKFGRQVLVSTRNAIRGPKLGRLRSAVEEKFKKLDERQKQARTAAVKIEAGFVRRFLELQEHGG